MSSLSPSSLQNGAALAPAAGPTLGWRLPMAGLLALGALALGWQGGVWGLLGALLATAAALLLARRLAEVGPSGSAPSSRPARAAGSGAGDGAAVMVSQVVPVWSRQVEMTRDSASEGLNAVLGTFSDMTQALQTLDEHLTASSVAALPGAVDGAVRGQSDALELLIAPSERAFAERDAAVAELGHCVATLGQLQQWAKQAREVARHTRLVAFNASIEANRQHDQRHGGTQSVAAEVRMLSDRMAHTTAQIEQEVNRLAARLQASHRTGELRDTTPQELRLEIDLQARAALNALLVAVGASLQGSTEVRQASQQLRDQLDAAFVHFQFGDRISQMLSIVSNDMGNFVRWVAAHPQATQTDAAEWLAGLEASYTMEEQRSQHHGNVHVESSSGVDFF